MRAKPSSASQVALHHSLSEPSLIPAVSLRTWSFLNVRSWQIRCQRCVQLSLCSRRISLAFLSTVKPVRTTADNTLPFLPKIVLITLTVLLRVVSTRLSYLMLFLSVLFAVAKAASASASASCAVASASRSFSVVSGLSSILKRGVVFRIDSACQDVVMVLARAVVLVAYLIVTELYLHGLLCQIKLISVLCCYQHRGPLSRTSRTHPCRMNQANTGSGNMGGASS